jgi:uncharacterized membrane protein
MKISQLKRKALLALKGNWGMAVLLSFIVFLVNLVLPTSVEIILSGGISEWLLQEQTDPGASFVGTIISFALIPFSVAVYWFYLSVVRNENPRIEEVFSIYGNGRVSLKLIGTSILQGIFVILWTLLFIIPGIIKSISYSQTFFLLKDRPELSPLQAITESKKRMKGLKGKYFLLGLSFIGWGILSICTLGIGFLWLVPYASTTLAAFYNELIATQKPINNEN